MLIITDADIRLFAAFLGEREYSPATIAKYAHDLRLLMDYAPDGIPDKAALVGFRDYLTERGYAPQASTPFSARSICFLPSSAWTGGSNISASSADPSCPPTGS